MPQSTLGEVKAIVVGETLMDSINHPGEPPKEHPGGSPLNMAIGLGRLGHPAMLVTWLGSDARGDIIKEHLAESSVCLVPGADKAERTSTAHIVTDETGHPAYTFDLLWQVPPVPDEAKPLVVHAGSMGAVFEPGADDVHAILAAGRQTATVTYDPNIRPDVMGTPENVRHLIERLVGVSDVVKVSDEDLNWLYPGADPGFSAEKWATMGPVLVILTRGVQGATALRLRGGELSAVEVPADTSLEVADAVGAGDSFMSGLIHALWERGLLGADRRAALAALPDEELRGILAFAARIAAITVSRTGANPPWLREL
ncbi:MAG: carbohydrate kinase [Propionibacteriaceae bacterium]|jgi:fructokinase|nr:carbohydrate kinase [Propionibacteriaceae bacterium]